MAAIINPFEAGGFTLAHMTRAINLIPNTYGKINSLGIFGTEPVSYRTVVVEKQAGELRLLPTRPVGAPATVGTSGRRSVRSFEVPHIPHNDVVLPEEVQGIRAFGQENGEDPIASLMARKLAKMRLRHAQTLEYMRCMALTGVTKDGNGETLYSWFDEFGYEQKSVDFKLGTNSTDVNAKCREIYRYIEDNLLGETMTDVLALVSPGFFDKLVAHSKVLDAYRYQQAPAVNPLKDDLRNGFRFGNVLFVEYAGAVTLANGTTARLITPNEGVAIPLGTTDTFTTYFAPANYMECVGTYGQELYAKQMTRTDDTGIDIFTQSNPLPIVKRPDLLVRIHTSD